MIDERIYVECTICSWGCSGSRFFVDDKADEHEYQNPGHTVKETTLEDNT